MGNFFINFYSSFFTGVFKKILKIESNSDKNINSSLKDIVRICEKMRHKYLNHENNLENETYELFNTDELFIQRIIRLNRNNLINDTDMKDHVGTILLAGTDTITVSLSNIILLLAMHREHQEKCYDEINDIVRDDEEINFETLKQLPYFHMCVRECLRLLPSIPLIGRKTSVKIDLGE